METTLATQDTLTLPTVAVVDAQIERATYIADKLAEIVTSRNWFADIQGKRYLEVEAWQFIGFQSGLDSDIEYTEPVYDGEEIVAYKSKAVLLRNGVQVSSGIMECGMSSFPTQGKHGRDKDKAAQSASQTWAISKSYRNKFSFIARMAGYEPTPAEEMHTTSEPKGEKGESLACPIHGTEDNPVFFFKSDRMRDYAHVVDGEQGPRGGKKWCNMPEAKARAASTISPPVTKNDLWGPDRQVQIRTASRERPEQASPRDRTPEGPEAPPKPPESATGAFSG